MWSCVTLLVEKGECNVKIMGLIPAGDTLSMHSRLQVALDKSICDPAYRAYLYILCNNSLSTDDHMTNT